MHHYHSLYVLTIKQAINTTSAYVSRYTLFCNINRKFNATLYDKHAHYELSTQVTKRNGITITLQQLYMCVCYPQNPCNSQLLQQNTPYKYKETNFAVKINTQKSLEPTKVHQHTITLF